jgi:histidine triad (HIT) family protein
MMARSFLVKTEFLSLLVNAARLRGARPLVRFFFNHMERFLPVDRLHENTSWVAFNHPQPNYALHILILPKSGVVSLEDAKIESCEFYSDLFQIVQSLILDYQLHIHGYRLITNGGSNQSIPQWHWHLISEDYGGNHA